MEMLIIVPTLECCEAKLIYVKCLEEYLETSNCYINLHHCYLMYPYEYIFLFSFKAEILVHKKIIVCPQNHKFCVLLVQLYVNIRNIIETLVSL